MKLEPIFYNRIGLKKFQPTIQEKERVMWGPVREESGGDAVLEADLGGFGGGDGREIEVSGEEEIPVNEESCSGSNTVWSGDRDSSHRRSFAGEN